MRDKREEALRTKGDAPGMIGGIIYVAVILGLMFLFVQALSYFGLGDAFDAVHPLLSEVMFWGLSIFALKLIYDTAAWWDRFRARN